MVKVSLTQKSIAFLKEKYVYVERVERYNPFSGKRNDFLGIGDVFATDGKELLVVQTTSAANASTRLKKAQKSKPLALWIQAGGNFTVHSWKKVKNRWILTERYI